MPHKCATAPTDAAVETARIIGLDHAIRGLRNVLHAVRYTPERNAVAGRLQAETDKALAAVPVPACSLEWCDKSECARWYFPDHLREVVLVRYHNRIHRALDNEDLSVTVYVEEFALPDGTTRCMAPRLALSDRSFSSSDDAVFVAAAMTRLAPLFAQLAADHIATATPPDLALGAGVLTANAALLAYESFSAPEEAQS